jgi:hypothetical protein
MSKHQIEEVAYVSICIGMLILYLGAAFAILTF